MKASPARLYLRRNLEAHLNELGYRSVRTANDDNIVPEIMRVNPVAGRLVYGETVLRGDLRRRRCHERLLSFSQRRTRHRSTILFFIGVAEADREELEALLVELDIRGGGKGGRGGHVHVVPIAAAKASPPS